MLDVMVIINHSRWPRILAAAHHWKSRPFALAFVDLLAKRTESLAVTSLHKLTEICVSRPGSDCPDIAPKLVRLATRPISVAVLQNAQVFIANAAVEATSDEPWNKVRKPFFAAIELSLAMCENQFVSKQIDTTDEILSQSVEAIIDARPEDDDADRLAGYLVSLAIAGNQSPEVLAHAREMFFDQGRAVYAKVMVNLMGDSEVEWKSLIDTLNSSPEQVRLFAAVAAALRPWIGTEKMELVNLVVLELVNPNLIVWGESPGEEHPREATLFFGEYCSALGLADVKRFIAKVFDRSSELTADQWRMARDVFAAFRSDLAELLAVFPIKERPHDGDDELQAIYDGIFQIEDS
jgi:hypothetical protein